jgi:hypothetical protein
MTGAQEGLRDDYAAPERSCEARRDGVMSQLGCVFAGILSLALAAIAVSGCCDSAGRGDRRVRVSAGRAFIYVGHSL